MTAVIVLLQMLATAGQTQRDLEKQHDEIMRELSEQEAGRDRAVGEVKLVIEHMKTGIESKLLPPLEKIARELELERTTRRQENQLDISAQVAQLAGNAMLFLVGLVFALNKALTMFGKKAKE